MSQPSVSGFHATDTSLSGGSCPLLFSEIVQTDLASRKQVDAPVQSLEIPPSDLTSRGWPQKVPDGPSQISESHTGKAAPPIVGDGDKFKPGEVEGALRSAFMVAASRIRADSVRTIDKAIHCFVFSAAQTSEPLQSAANAPFRRR